MLGIIKSPFTPLEKAADFNRRSLPLEANGGFPPEADSPSEKKPLLAQTVRERSSLTGFTNYTALIICDQEKISFIRLCERPRR